MGENFDPHLLTKVLQFRAIVVFCNKVDMLMSDINIMTFIF